MPNLFQNAENASIVTFFNWNMYSYVATTLKTKIKECIQIYYLDKNFVNCRNYILFLNLFLISKFSSIIENVFYFLFSFVTLETFWTGNLKFVNLVWVLLE